MPVERPVSVLTGLDQFFGGFLNFKISKRLRPLCPQRPRPRSGIYSVQSSLVSGFLPVFETGP